MSVDDCPAFRGQRRVIVVAVAYAPLREMITEFLARDHKCWSGTSATLPDLAGAIERNFPDVVIVDAADFPRCCGPEFGGIPTARVVVIGHEPGHAYRTAALAHGAGAWVAADAIGDELTTEMHAVLGCPNCAPARFGLS